MNCLCLEDSNNQIETLVPSKGPAGVNEVSVRNVNDPMPTGQEDIGTILLSPFGDGDYSVTLCY